ncbi:MAG: M20/M25/M40 family metallo-hydrolase [FCB group bacterium]|nr:M20/M25/M40 family metallo-hydrolase [FCB group bacterium]
MIKRILLGLGGGLAFLLLVLFANTLKLHSKQLEIAAVKPVIIPDSALEHLSAAIKIPTISTDDSTRFNPAPFTTFLELLERTYPLCNTLLTKTIINHYGLLYQWPGQDTSLKPILLTAHYDVVPVDTSYDGRWTEPPFSGKIDGQFIWGRGTMDDKLGVIGILEAAEGLLKNGFVPERTIYLAFGYDEEINGLQGAARIAAYLGERNIRFDYVLDEGLLIARGLVPGITKDVALVGLSEKGFLSVKLSVIKEGGHASMPQSETVIDILANAVLNLRRHRPEARISEPVERFLEFIGPEMPFFQKLVFANKGLLGRLILKAYEQSPAGNSLVRTTTAPTVFSAGSKANVLPGTASAIVNFRILPGETIEGLLDHVKKTIDDPRVTVEVSGAAVEPSPVSSTDSKGFITIEKTLRQIYPKALVAASLVTAGTDSRHYTSIADDVYRFSPQTATAEDLLRIHGRNERIAKEDFKNCIRFYRQLIVNTNP